MKLIYSLVTISMKHHLTDTHEYTLDIHNIVLFTNYLELFNPYVI